MNIFNAFFTLKCRVLTQFHEWITGSGSVIRKNISIPFGLPNLFNKTIWFIIYTVLNKTYFKSVD